MISKHSNEDGIAYSTILVLIFSILLTIGLYLTFGYGINLIMTATQSGTMPHPMSDQTRAALDFNILFFSGIPLVTMIGSYVWSVNAAANARNGSRPIFQTFSMGWLLMLTAVIVSLTMTLCGGIFFDQMLIPGVNDMINATSVSPTWQDMSENYGFISMNMWYLLCYIVPIVGYLIFGISLFARTSGDRYYG